MFRRVRRPSPAMVVACLALFVALGLAFNWNFFTRKFLLFRPETASEAIAGNPSRS